MLLNICFTSHLYLVLKKQQVNINLPIFSQTTVELIFIHRFLKSELLSLHWLEELELSLSVEWEVKSEVSAVDIQIVRKFSLGDHPRASCSRHELSKSVFSQRTSIFGLFRQPPEVTHQVAPPKVSLNSPLDFRKVFRLI